MSTVEMFKTELETYQKHKDSLVGESEGKYVLIRGNAIHGVWSSYEDALQAGYQTFGLEPFFIKQIQAIERVQHFN